MEPLIDHEFSCEEDREIYENHIKNLKLLIGNNVVWNTEYDYDGDGNIYSIKLDFSPPCRQTG